MRDIDVKDWHMMIQAILDLSKATTLQTRAITNNTEMMVKLHKELKKSKFKFTLPKPVYSWEKKH